MTTSSIVWTLHHETTDLRILGGNYSVDEINVPAVSGTFLVPDTPGLLEDLDPRNSTPPRVQIDAIRTYLSGPFPDPPDTMSMSLHARRVVRDRLDGTLAVSVASDEALLTDWSPVSQSELDALIAQRSPGDSVGTLVNIILDVVIGRQLTPGVYDVDTPSTDIPWTIDMSAWDMIRPILDDTNTKLRVHPDGITWTLERPENPIGGFRDYPFTYSDIARATEEYSRTGDWYDSALLVAEDTTTGEDQSAGYPPGPHSRTYRERKPRGSVVSTSQAQNIVTRAAARGFLVQLDIPLKVGLWMRDFFAYRAHPDDPLFGDFQVSSVSHDITADVSSVTGIQPY